MREFIVASGDQLRRLNQTGGDHYEEIHGRVRKVFCTQKYLRDRIREVFDNRSNADPLVIIQTQRPNCTYEGIKITGWCSGGGVEIVQCSSQQFEILNICRFQVLS